MRTHSDYIIDSRFVFTIFDVQFFLLVFCSIRAVVVSVVISGLDGFHQTRCVYA